MTGEHAGSSDSEEILSSPKDLLDRYLTGERPGSVRVRALADVACLVHVQGKIATYTEDKPSEQSHYLSEVMELSHIRETMRKRSYGSQAVKYTQATEEAARVVAAYVDRYREGLTPIGEPMNRAYASFYGTEPLLSDLDAFITAASSQITHV